MKEYETRYFAGIEFPNGIQLKKNDQKKIPKLWDRFYEGGSAKIGNQVNPNHVIGLQIYPFDFKEIATYDYFALAETKELIEATEGIVTKKLRKGKKNSNDIFKKGRGENLSINQANQIEDL